MSPSDKKEIYRQLGLKHKSKEQVIFEGKKTLRINYTPLFLRQRLATIGLLREFKFDEDIILQMVEYVRGKLKQEIILQFASTTCWDKEETIPAVVGKSIIDTDSISHIEGLIMDTLSDFDNISIKLMELLDELFLEELETGGILAIKSISGWDVLDIHDQNGIITIVNYGDYRVLAWEYMKETKALCEAVDDMVSEDADAVNQLVITHPSKRGRDRLAENIFKSEKRKH